MICGSCEPTSRTVGSYCVKNTNLNDDRQNGNRSDRYHLVQVTQEVSGYFDKCMGFHFTYLVFLMGGDVWKA